MIKRLMAQMNVPKDQMKDLQKEIHEGLKTAFGIESLAKLSDREKWQYVQDVEIMLTVEYGYVILDEEELKFHDLK
jgi:hypothetical protein